MHSCEWANWKVVFESFHFIARKIKLFLLPKMYPLAQRKSIKKKQLIHVQWDRGGQLWIKQQLERDLRYFILSNLTRKLWQKKISKEATLEGKY